MDLNNLKNSGFVKTILMLLVILGHACAFWSGHWFTENPAIQSVGLNAVYSWINSFHIYAFALASGYIFAFKISGGGYSAYAPFLKNKAKRLLIPYMFVTLIWVAPISAYFFKWDLDYLAKKYLLCIDPSQLWFLWMLFGVFAIIWPLKKVMIKKPVCGWGMAIIFYGIGIVGKSIFPNVFCVWTAFQYVPLFFIGMRIRIKEECGARLVTGKATWYSWIVADLIIFAGTMIIGRYSGVVWSLTVVGLNFVLHIVGAIMAWTTLQELANKVNWKNSRAFKTLSSYSMPMYLLHQQIIYLTIIWLNGKVNPWINAGVNFIVALAGSFLISSVLMRWKVTRFLIGEK